MGKIPPETLCTKCDKSFFDLWILSLASIDYLKESVVIKEYRIPSVCKTVPVSVLQFCLMCKAVFKNISYASCRHACFNLIEFLKGCIVL